MLLKSILLLTLVSILPVVITNPSQLCSTTFVNICFSCQHIDGLCDNITDNMKIIVFPDNKKIDYSWYIRTNIRIIIQTGKLTFFSCNKNWDFIEVDPNYYYPHKIKLNLSNIHVAVTYSKVVTEFQTCVQTYCSNQNNHFECYNHVVDNLNFEFDTSVNPKCLQNITFASIESPNLKLIEPNTFFLNVFNLIYLKLELINLKTFQFNVLQNLKFLKMIKLVYFNRNLVCLDCIFRFNPNLVLINAQDTIVWNSCNYSALRKGSSNVNNMSSILTIFHNEPQRSLEVELKISCVFLIYSAMFLFAISAIFVHLYCKKLITTNDGVITGDLDTCTTRTL